MGSIANFHCSYLCCTRYNHSVPKSDLFIPQFDTEDDVPKKTNKKKLLKTVIINKKNVKYNRVTTERFIQSKPRIRNSYTLNTKRIKKTFNRNLTLNTNRKFSGEINIKNQNKNETNITKLNINDEYSKSKTMIKKDNINNGLNSKRSRIQISK